MALVLDATTKKLQAKLGEVISTAQPVVVASWADMTTTAFTPGETDTTMNGTTAVDIVAAPASSTQRLLREIFIYNNDTIAHTLVVIYNNNGTLRTFSPNTSVPAGSVLYWSTESGWKIGVASGGGSSGSTTFIGLTDVPASFTGQTLKGVRVNAGETALEFYTIGASDPFSVWTTVPASPGWDPNYVGGTANVTLSNSNKRATPVSGTPWNFIFGTPAKMSGKKYFEMKMSSTTAAAAGVCSVRSANKPQGGTFGDDGTGMLGWNPGGTVRASYDEDSSAYTVTTIQTYSAGDDLCFAVDLDNHQIWFRTNAGNWNNSGAADPTTNAGGISLAHAFNFASAPILWPGANMGNTGNIDLFLKSADWTRSAPSGFTQWGA